MYFNREEPPSGSVNNPLLLLLLLLLLSSDCGAGKKRPRARKMRELFAQRTSKFFFSPGICKLGICPFSVLLM